MHVPVDNSKLFLQSVHLPVVKTSEQVLQFESWHHEQYLPSPSDSCPSGHESTHDPDQWTYPVRDMHSLQKAELQRLQVACEHGKQLPPLTEYLESGQMAQAVPSNA